jgi:hypothetical protein
MNSAAEIIVQFLYKSEIRLNEGENKGKMWLKRENIRKWCKKRNYEKIHNEEWNEVQEENRIKDERTYSEKKLMK